jgi:hypothetical protein
VILKPLAGRLRVSLLYRESADDLEDKISTLVAHVSRVQEIFLAGVQLQPAICIAESLGFARGHFMAESVTRPCSSFMKATEPSGDAWAMMLSGSSNIWRP